MNTSQILNHTADLLNTATSTLLAHPDALDRAPELMELHLAEGKVRAAVTGLFPVERGGVVSQGARALA